jgi:hypothetical protein
VPSSDTKSAATHAWRSFSQLFKRKADPETPVQKEQDLYLLPEARLAHLMPPLEWKDAALSLESVLQEWLDSDTSSNGVRFYIGQPFAGHDQIVSLLGKHRNATEITPPSTNEILEQSQGWFDHWPSQTPFWVLPNLEWCFLRHTHGLEMIRYLMDNALSGKLGKGVIGCSSWAWAWLQKALPLADANTLTLQAFDGERLRDLLRHTMSFRTKSPVYCYNAKNGSTIIGPPQDEDPLQKEFTELAGHCRGNPATAVWYWRERLRCRPDETLLSAEEKDSTLPDKATPAHDKDAIWLTGMPTEPQLPTAHEEEVLLLLHTLLLHGGLPETLIPKLIPLSAPHCNGLLRQLRQLGFTRFQQDRWYIHPSAYGVVRRTLASRDYLTDSF